MAGNENRFVFDIDFGSLFGSLWGPKFPSLSLTFGYNFEFLCQVEGYIPAPYLASRGMKWIQQTDTSGPLDDDLKYYLSESYRIVALGLSKRKRQELGIADIG